LGTNKELTPFQIRDDLQPCLWCRWQHLSVPMPRWMPGATYYRGHGNRCQLHGMLVRLAHAVAAPGQVHSRGKCCTWKVPHSMQVLALCLGKPFAIRSTHKTRAKLSWGEVIWGQTIRRTDRPTDQRTNGSTDQWTNRPTNQQTDGPMNQWINGPMDRQSDGPSRLHVPKNRGG
jgi:hypothetical protein